MTTSMRQGELVTLPSVGLFADGAAVKTVGDETFRICNALVEESVEIRSYHSCHMMLRNY